MANIMNHQNDIKVRNRIKHYRDNIVDQVETDTDTTDTAL